MENNIACSIYNYVVDYIREYLILQMKSNLSQKTVFEDIIFRYTMVNKNRAKILVPIIK